MIVFDEIFVSDFFAKFEFTSETDVFSSGLSLSLCRLEYFPSVSKKMHIIDYQRKTLFFVCNIWKLYNFFLGIPRINGLRYYLNPSISIRKFKFNSSFHSLNIFQRWENDFEFLPFYFSRPSNFKKIRSIPRFSHVKKYDPSYAGSRSRKSKVGRLL